MRLRKRLLSLLLAAVLTLPALPAARAAAVLEGEISATVRVDWPQSLETLQDREIQAELFHDGRSLGAVPLTEDSTATLSGYPAKVRLRNRDGGGLAGGRWPGYLDLTVSDLPQGSYTLEISGEGYVTCRQKVSLDEYSQHITVGTSDAAFALGDVNGDGKLNSRDQTELSQTLGSTSRRDLQRYDLSGDGVIDIYDLSYLTRNLSASGQPEVQSTVQLNPPLDHVRLEGNTRLLSGNLEELLWDNGQPVTLTANGQPVKFSLSLSEPVEMEELQIISPEGPGSAKSGYVTVVYTDDEEETVPFDLTLPEDIHAISDTEGKNIVKVALGRRVAVKEITVTVIRAEGGEYVTVESVQFLKEIVPEHPAGEQNQVKNLTASAGDGKVSLRWNELPNVSGYRVDYWLENGASKSITVDTAQAEITGLDNMKTYFFTVTPVDGSWTGTACDPVSATPEPAKAPDAPDMVNVTALDEALSVSWKTSKNATFYEVWYKTQYAADGIANYIQWGGTLNGTNTTITGLTNNVAYEVYVKAGNTIGISGASRVSLGTPIATDYSRPEGIPTEGVIDWEAIERVWLANENNVSPTAYPASQPFKPENMADGDFRTHWTSHSYGDGNWWNNKQVLASFKRPVDLSAVIWVSRLDGSYASNLRLYTVTVWRQGDELNGPGTLMAPNPLQGGSASDHNTWLNVGNNPSVTKFAVLPFEPVTDVVKIAVTIEQRAYTAVSLSELMFMEYDPARCLPDEIEGLFGDGLRTTLRGGVTQGQIDALRQRLDSDEKNYYLNTDALSAELDLAEELLAGRFSGVLLNGIQSRSSGPDNEAYKQGGSALQPLGVASNANQEITVYASGIPDGQRLTVYASQYNSEASSWLAEIGALANGRNVLTVPKIGSQNTPRGGSLYLSYGGTSPKNIKLHICRAADIPVLELADWYVLSKGQRDEALGNYVDELNAYVTALKLTNATRETNCLNVTEISTPTMLLSLPAAAALGGAGQSRTERVETLYQTVEAWEDIMHICKTTQGIDKTYEQNDMQTRQNIRCMQMFSGAFMYAAGNHIGIGYGSCAGMVCGKPIKSLGANAGANKLFGWGIAHEIGHNMDKLGKAEVTNNLYSLMVQTYDGNRNILSSRLETSGKYDAIFNKTAQGLPGDCSDVFVQLGLYWQLHLAYDEGDKPMDFYNRFFKAWKSGAYFSGADSYQDRFALTACAIAERDLTEFFTRWGMTLSDSAKGLIKSKNYTEESRAIWYLSDQSRRERLAGTRAAEGKINSVSAEVTKDNEITLTLNTNFQSKSSLQGIEILRSSDGGKTYQPIAFINGTTYTDVIGSANHRTFQYKACVIDILGNNIASGFSNEVRIAYDKTVPASSRTVERKGNSAVFTLTEAAPVSGVIFKGASLPASGEFTVTVTDKDGNTVTARTGSFDTGNQAADTNSAYLTYLQKPKAPAEDTRIWIYDAKTVTITGVPDGFPLEGIQLLSYAGDDVAFLEDGAVGVLAHDYRYGSGEDQIIPAGTLVMAGTYRGDPAYQTVKIEGRFIRTVLSGDDETRTETETRWLDGRALLFAEVPEDGKVSDISDGFFLFIPNIQRETELQGENCNAATVLPAQARAVLSRTDAPELTEKQRVTAETLWINTPGGTDLPEIVLEEEG